MYIERLNSWGKSDWRDFFSQYHLNPKDEKRVRKILSSLRKEEIESNFWNLIELWILNGIWPWYLMKWTRKFISWLFRWVKYEWHDIMYAIWWNERDRLDADYWLLKYSYLSVRIFIIKSRMALNPLLFLLLYPIALIQILLALFCYIMVMCFGRFWSFRYINKKI